MGRRTSSSCCHFFSQLLVPAHLLSMLLLGKQQRLSCFFFSAARPWMFVLLHAVTTLARAVTAHSISCCLIFLSVTISQLYSYTVFALCSIDGGQTIIPALLTLFFIVSISMSYFNTLSISSSPSCVSYQPGTLRTLNQPPSVVFVRLVIWEFTFRVKSFVFLFLVSESSGALRLTI